MLMRKIYTLILLSIVFSITTLAQSADTRFRFVRGDGTVIEPGSVLTFSNVEETPFGDMQIKPDIYLQNVSGSSIPMAVTGSITSLPSGRIQFCAFGLCSSYDKRGKYEKRGVLDKEAKDDLMLEWIPQGAKVEGTIATILIDTRIYDAGDNNGTGSTVLASGPSITVHFAYPSTSGIKSEKSKKHGVKRYYNIFGQRIDKLQKGINIIVRDDGKIVKQISK